MAVEIAAESVVVDTNARSSESCGPVFSGSSWSGEEEEQLLELLEDRGYGNWSSIGALMGKAAEECRAHYEEFYVTNPHPKMPSLLLPRCCVRLRQVPAYNECLVWEGNPHASEQPHPVSFGIDGYMPFRAEFSKEWFDRAEVLLAGLSGRGQTPETGPATTEEDTVDHRIIADLKVAVIDRYNNILRQRQERRRVMRDYGTLATAKAGEEDKLILKKWSVKHRLSRFMRLLPPREYDLLLQGLYDKIEVETRIKKLQHYRKSGIQRHCAAGVYDSVQQLLRRDRLTYTKLHLTKLSLQIAEQMGVSRSQSTVPAPGTKALTSLKGDTAYHRLDNDEKELCLAHSLPPSLYLKHKKLLVEETRRKGPGKKLFLHDARRLLRIDVNKTRKVFDLLVKKEVINHVPIEP